VGMIPSAATMKINAAEAWASSSATAAGMNGTSRYGHPCALVRNSLADARWTLTKMAAYLD
jgi:hypothetical protein